MKTITSLTAAAVLFLGTLPATADSETEDRETRRGKARAELMARTSSVVDLDTGGGGERSC